MLLLKETVFPDLEIELHDDLSYRLRYRDRVEYWPQRRRVGGRTLSYDFTSVEQLRYDFEQDVLASGGGVGEGT
jgi:hypothetical protein